MGIYDIIKQLSWWLRCKKSACNAGGDLALIPGSGISLEKGVATHSSILAFHARTFHGQRRLAGYIVHGVAKSYIGLND